MTLYLVRHGRPVIDPDSPPDQWRLDPAWLGDFDAIRSRLPRKARWVSSPEPKAVDSARLAGGRGIEVCEELREIGRTPIDPAAFDDAVRRTFADLDTPAYPGWETGRECQRRITPAVRALLPAHWRDHLVLVGHGTAFTLLIAALTGTTADHRRWRALAMPDLIRLDTRQIVAED